jgi:hypothetical protein
VKIQELRDLGIWEFRNLGIKDGRIHDCDKMVVEKTSGMGRISLHEKSLVG